MQTLTIARFEDLALAQPIQRAVAEEGYTTPTPIQQQAIPHLLEGRDLLGCAQTGTGKTAAFALPILHRLGLAHKKPTPRHTRVLVLVPTRELAVQVHDSFRVYGKHLHIKTAVVYGGVGQGTQVRSLQTGVDILVATPGRLLDLIDQGYLRLDTLEVFVLDEADRMLDMGFIQPIRQVIEMLPPRRHNLFFSATMPPPIQKLAGRMLVNPVRVEVTPVASTVEIIDQSVMYVEHDRKRDLLVKLFQDKSLSRVIVFTRTKHGANRVAEMLDKSGTPADAIHGNKSQSARQRALENFRVGKIRALVATDLAARGIDVDGVTHVINFEIPNESESYVHRIGRTARAGASGKAISLCDDEERAYMKDIERLINKKIRVDEGQPYHSDRIANLTNTPRPAPARKGGGGHGHARGKNHPRSSNGRAGSGSSGNRSSRNSGRRR
jgi:ATP-dependent RNA helicase RhlE